MDLFRIIFFTISMGTMFLLRKEKPPFMDNTYYQCRCKGQQYMFYSGSDSTVWVESEKKLIFKDLYTGKMKHFYEDEGAKCKRAKK